MAYIFYFFPAVAAAVASTILGALWYSPVLFGRQWAALMETSGARMLRGDGSGGGAAYAASFALDVVTAAVLSFLISALALGNVLDVLGVVFWIWLGFAAPLAAGEVFWGGRPWRLFALNAGYRLAAIGAMGVVLSALL